MNTKQDRMELALNTLNNYYCEQFLDDTFMLRQLTSTERPLRDKCHDKIMELLGWCIDQPVNPNYHGQPNYLDTTTGDPRDTSMGTV